MSLPTTKVHEWTRNEYLISTDQSIIPLDSLNEALGSSRLGWAKKLSDDEIKVMVQSSACFGLYSTDPSGTPTRSLVGFARLVTDKVTFAYMTDVYVLPEHEGRGLSSWLMDCIKEWTNLIPNLRQFVLITGRGRKEDYYAKKFGTRTIENWSPGLGTFVVPGPGWSNS